MSRSGEQPAAQTPVVDGRSQRSNNSRSKILEATIALMLEAPTAPSAKKVAARAKVGLRSVFRHFSDMEQLFADLNEELDREYRPRLQFERDLRPLPLDQRVHLTVTRRAALFLELRNIILNTKRRFDAHSILRQQYSDLVQSLEKHIVDCLPEVDMLSANDKHHIMAVMSFEFLDLQTRIRKLSEDDAVQLVEDIVVKMLDAK